MKRQERTIKWQMLRALHAKALRYGPTAEATISFEEMGLCHQHPLCMDLVVQGLADLNPDPDGCPGIRLSKRFWVYDLRELYLYFKENVK